MTLPTLDDATFATYRDPSTRLWTTLVLDGANTIYGFTTGRNPHRALARAVDVVTRKAPRSRLQLVSKDALDALAAGGGVTLDVIHAP